MTSIEELIRKKLDVALTEEKKRLATSLFELTTAGPDKKTATPPTDGAQKQQRQEAMRQKIQALQAKITELSSAAPKAADPDKMRDQLSVQKAKLDLAKKELAAIG